MHQLESEDGELVIVTGLFVAQQRQRLADALWHISGRMAPERHQRIRGKLKARSGDQGCVLCPGSGGHGEYGVNAPRGVLRSAHRRLLERIRVLHLTTLRVRSKALRHHVYETKRSSRSVPPPSMPFKYHGRSTNIQNASSINPTL